jgi:hypothetical protein
MLKGHYVLLYFSEIPKKIVKIFHIDIFLKNKQTFLLSVYFNI